MKKIDFFEFAYIWFKLQNQSLPKHQIKITKWLAKIWSSNDKRNALLMAFRNSGKSTIVGLFCAWALYKEPSTRILVIAADHALAKKMVRNVKKIIEQHPLTLMLKPKRLEQWASDQFTIIRDTELRDPSMLAKGLQANITGLRADLIICDDVEVPKNCDSHLKRQDMREKLQELDYILTPQGMQLYIGTPHTYYTIYQNKVDIDKKETEPFLLGFEKLEIPILNSKNESAWPERFAKEKIASIRARSGESKFLSQMMLKPLNITESVLDPNRLVPYQKDLNIIFSHEKEVLKLGDNRLISSSCWWDPSFAVSGRKGDNSVIACIYTDEEGRYWLHDIEYIKVQDSNEDNVASKQCEIVANFLERNFLPSIKIEANGIGKFLPSILRQVLQEKKLSVSVVEVFSKSNKANRILEAFEVLLADRALNVNQKIWQSPFIEEMREWNPISSQHDDGLDAVAGCLLSEPVRLIGHKPNTKNFKANRWQGTSSSFRAKSDFEL